MVLLLNCNINSVFTIKITFRPGLGLIWVLIWPLFLIWVSGAGPRKWHYKVLLLLELKSDSKVQNVKRYLLICMFLLWIMRICHILSKFNIILVWSGLVWLTVMPRLRRVWYCKVSVNMSLYRRSQKQHAFWDLLFISYMSWWSVCWERCPTYWPYMENLPLLVQQLASTHQFNTCYTHLALFRLLLHFHLW